jgi:hypothetical protein
VLRKINKINEVPAGVTATAGDAQVALKWNPSTSAASYKVKRSTANGGAYTEIASTVSTNYSDASVVNGTTYYYVVAAANSAGVSSNSAQVSATPATTKIPNLTGINIGTNSSGSSKVLADHSWEINGAGTGIRSSQDNFHFEFLKKTNDFQVIAKINNLTTSGVAPRAGLMIRESNENNARFVSLSVTTGTQYALGSRTATGGLASESLTSNYQLPNAWMLLQKRGTNIVASVSADGFNFNQVGTVALSGVSNSVNVGLFSSGGTSGINASLKVTDFDLADLFVDELSDFTKVFSRSGLTDESVWEIRRVNSETKEGDEGRAVRTGQVSPGQVAELIYQVTDIKDFSMHLFFKSAFDLSLVKFYGSADNVTYSLIPCGVTVPAPTGGTWSKVDYSPTAASLSNVNYLKIQLVGGSDLMGNRQISSVVIRR